LVHRVRRNWQTALYALAHSGSRWMIQYLTPMTQSLRNQKATEIQLSMWVYSDLISLARLAATHPRATSLLATLLDHDIRLHCCHCSAEIVAESLKLCSNCNVHMAVCKDGKCWDHYWKSVHKNECGRSLSYVKTAAYS
jgi:hypothetical protein